MGIPEVRFVCIRVYGAAAHRLQITVHEKDGLRVVFAFEVDKSPKTVCGFALFDRLSARLLVFMLFAGDDQCNQHAASFGWHAQ